MKKYLFIFLICIFFLTACDDADVSSNDLEAGNSSLIAVGDAGTVFISTDGGSNWSQSVTGTTDNILDVTCSDNSAVAITASNAYFSADGGSSWSSSSQAFTGLLTVTFGEDTFVVADEGTAAANDGAAYFSTDGGVTWTQFSETIAVAGDERYVVYGSTNGEFVMANDGTLAWDSSDGTDWEGISNNPGIFNNFLHFANGYYFTFGSAFTDISEILNATNYVGSGGPESSTTGIVFFDGVYYAVNTDGDIYYTSDPLDWANVTVFSDGLNDIVHDGSNFFAPADAGKIYSTSNISGLTFENSVTLGTANFNAIASCD